MLAHGIFDYIIMLSSTLGDAVPFLGTALFVLFIYFDIKLWKLGLKYIRKQQENSRLQAQANTVDDDTALISNTEYDPEYKQIDWNAGNR